MANDRIEQYLEAILEKLNDGTETGVPVPAWNIEKYLAAIYDKCGGAEDFVVTFSGSTSGGDAAVDKTMQEINEAFLAGKIINLRYDDRGGSIYELQKMYSAPDGRIITLCGAYYDYDHYAIHCEMGAPDTLFIKYEEY